MERLSSTFSAEIAEEKSRSDFKTDSTEVDSISLLNTEDEKSTLGSICQARAKTPKTNELDIETISKNTHGTDVEKKKEQKKRNFNVRIAPQQTTLEYLEHLTNERNNLEALPNVFNFNHVIRLVNDELARVRRTLANAAGSMQKTSEQHKYMGNHMRNFNSVFTNSGTRVVLQEKVFVPTAEYPNYNFVGRILGPRGMTAKQLEQQYGCKIMVRGRGSTREDGCLRQRCNDNLTEDLHVLVQCEDFQPRAKQKLQKAVECINNMLKPPPEGEDELKRKQLMELSIINGTYRPTNASKLGIQSPRMLSSVSHNASRSEYGVSSQNSRPPNSSNKSSASVGHTETNNIDNNISAQNTRTSRCTPGVIRTRTFFPSSSASRHNYNNLFGTERMAQHARIANPFGFAPQPDSLSSSYLWNPALASSMFGVLNGRSTSLSSEYYQQILTNYSLDQSMSLVNTRNTTGSTSRNNAATIPPANLQQYMAAAAMLNSVPYLEHDGSGDCLSPKRRANC